MLLNRERAEKMMEKYHLDALIATSNSNVFYTSDVSPYGDNFVLLLKERKHEPTLVCPLIGSTPVVLNSPSWIKDIRYYGEFFITKRFAQEPLTSAEQRYIEAAKSWEKKKEEDPNLILIELLEERGLEKGRIGVDESNLPSEH
jgi:Xaa-Pro aminopeptidase